MRRVSILLLRAFGTLAGFAILLVVALMFFGNSAAGRLEIERWTDRLSGGVVKLSGLGGAFPSDLTLEQLQLVDGEGVWLSAERISVRWSPRALLARRIQVTELKAAKVDFARLPVSGKDSGGPVSIPHIDVAKFTIDELDLGAPLTGRATQFTVSGGTRLRSWIDGDAEVEVHRTDGNGEYHAVVHLDSERMAGTLDLHEPAGGPLETLLQLPGLGALSAHATVKGLRSAENVEATIDAGDLHARATGSVDLAKSSANLQYSLEAPAMSPRADIGWQTLKLNGQWRGLLTSPANADGRLDVTGLKLAGSVDVDRLGADLSAVGSTLAAKATVEGLNVQGLSRAQQLLARDPISLSASMRLDEAARPLEVTAAHRLFTLRGKAVTADNPGATFELRLPNVAPFAALAGEDVRGAAVIQGEVKLDQSVLRLTADAGLNVAGGAAAWVPLVGNRMTLKLAGALSDDAIRIERLALVARSMTFDLDGTAVRRKPKADASAASKRARTIDDFIEKLQARWQLRVDDLAPIVPDVGGTLQASGTLNGPPSSFIGEAELKSTLSVRGSPEGNLSAQLHLRGLPSAAAGTIEAEGELEDAPLALDVAVSRGVRGGLQADIKHAQWKSSHLEGEVHLEGAMADSTASLRFGVDNLADFDHLSGMKLAGRVAGSGSVGPEGGASHLKFVVDAKEVLAGAFAGDAHLAGDGPLNALNLRLTTKVPELNGAPASASVTALLDIETRELRISAASATYRDQVAKLLAPVKFSFMNELVIDHLEFGSHEAVLEVDGQIAPVLDLHGSLRGVRPRLVNAFFPDLLSEGTIEGQLRLTGTLAAPVGTIGLTAQGLRSTDTDAAALPALDMRMNATLDGTYAVVAGRLSSGTSSSVTVSGSVPLQPSGALDLVVLGKVDVGVLNPLLEGHGMRAGGLITADATVKGPSADPQIHGTVTLASGNWRDYAHGLNFSDINAEVTGDESMLKITHFQAKAASGPVNVTGTIGVLQPKIPVDLRLTATNAEPIASNIVTANLNADVHVTGTMLERIDIGGKINVNRATVGIPNSLPPNVAVLDVRRRGKQAVVRNNKLVIGLDVAVHARRQILVQGRGLDAELAGDAHVGGTTDSPLITGGFQLQRGSISISGNKLTLTPPGSVSFDGGGLEQTIDPRLDFTAKAYVTGATVTLLISGHADAPKFEFTSDPPYGQDEIMARLLFGEPSAQLSALQVAEIGSALATLTGVGGDGPLVRLQKTLGLDRLSVSSNTTTTATGATENSGAAIQAGRYISKRVYVEVKQTTTGGSQVQTDVDLTKHLKLQTRLGNGTAITQGTTPENDPGSSIGLSYQFEY